MTAPPLPSYHGAGDMRDRTIATWTALDEGQETAHVRRCQLTVVDGPDQGQTFSCATTRILIGRSRTGDCVLNDRRVSSSHCEITLRPEGYLLRDLESSNGTLVDDKPIRTVFIKPGAHIVVGDTRLLFEALDSSVGEPLPEDERFHGLVGRSTLMRQLFARLQRIASTDTTVLITGATGTGKDVIAESIHAASERKGKPFVVVDCGAISHNLIESEIFGHERGAFTGAVQTHTGAFERADGGTLFLDEIGELPLDVQPKLLRALERKQFRRVGGTDVKGSNIRFIAATNRDLEVEVNRGGFREDLYYRLAVARVQVPSLAERPEDVAPLVEHFLMALNCDRSLARRLSPLLKQYHWPGNVRELRNIVDRYALLGEQPRLSIVADGTSPGTASVDPSPQAGEDTLHFGVDITIPYKEAKKNLLTAFHSLYVARLLERHEYNIAAASRATGIDRATLTRLVKEAGITVKK